MADLIDAVTPLQARAAFDQLEGTLTWPSARLKRCSTSWHDSGVARLSDEGYHFVAPQEARDSLAGVIAGIDSLLAQAERGRLIREGAQVAIAGAPNVGSRAFSTRC